MNVAILTVQIIVALTQLAFLILGLLLLAGLIRNNEQTNAAANEQARAKAAMDEALAAEPESGNYDPWSGRWPPWDTPGTENTTN